MSDITAVCITSPTPGNPSTEILDTTLASVRHHLPDAETLVCCDGPNPALLAEHPDRGPAYSTFLRRVTRACLHDWLNTVPLLATEWLHQASLVRLALDEVDTPLVLLVEGDCPLSDEYIDWESCAGAVRSGALDVIRFSHEAQVLPDHDYLMLDPVPSYVGGVRVRRTAQFSARPHLASAGWYRTMLRAWFTPDARTYIEDRLYGVILDAYHQRGDAGWDEARMGIYAPHGASIKRSYTLDGRGDLPKYDGEGQLIF